MGEMVFRFLLLVISKSPSINIILLVTTQFRSDSQSLLGLVYIPLHNFLLESDTVL